MKRLIRAASDYKETIEQWIRAVEENDYQPFDKYQLQDPQEEFIDSMPFELIDVGSYRAVFDLKDKVLKVAITPNGINNVDTETSMLENTPDVLKKHLAHVHESGHGWLIMDQLNKELPQTQEYIDRVLQMEQEFKDSGIEPLDVTYYHDEEEPNWENLRLNDEGEIVIIDYGNFE